MDATKTGNQTSAQAGQGQDGFPVDNQTYNLMHALVSTLESIEVYKKYQKDGNQELFQELLQQDQQNARKLVSELKQALQRY